MAHPPGFEPGTAPVTAACSAVELEVNGSGERVGLPVQVDVEMAPLPAPGCQDLGRGSGGPLLRLPSRTGLVITRVLLPRRRWCSSGTAPRPTLPPPSGQEQKMTENEPWIDTAHRIYQRASERAYGAQSESIAGSARRAIGSQRATQRHREDLGAAAARPAREKLLGELEVLERCLREDNPSPEVEAYLHGRLRKLEDGLGL